MKKSNNKYIYFLIGTIILFVLIHLLSPKQFNWTPTFSSRDKNPFGSFVMNQLLSDVFPDQKVINNNITFYEAHDSISNGRNIIALSIRMNLEKEDTKALLKMVDDGATAFLSANYFSGPFGDTLGIRTEDALMNLNIQDLQLTQDSTYLKFSYGKPSREYFYKRSDVNTYFTDLDSIKTKVYVVAQNESANPVTLRIPWGSGQFIINTTPLAFTNNYLLYSNHRFISQTLSYLPERPIWWTEYYHLGRMESGSPLRVILRSEPLSWAYYLLMTTLLIFIIFGGKRKQRIIPVIKPLTNSSLEFIRTVGNMYVQSGNHKAIAEKKITYFFEHIRSAYFLPPENHEEFSNVLAKKSGNSNDDTEALLSLIKIIQRSPIISDKMLMDLNKKIEKFNHLHRTTI